jgi:hypothetical protein
LAEGVASDAVMDGSPLSSGRSSLRAFFRAPDPLGRKKVLE